MGFNKMEETRGKLGTTVGSPPMGVASSPKTAAALTLKEGAKEAAKRAGAEGLKRFAGSNLGLLWP